MDLKSIFHAQVSILAAACDGSDYGLPGVRATMRRRQPQLLIDDFAFGLFPPTSNVEDEQLKWASRGWTYQEGLLSKRRLNFTDQQVFFHCNGMHCREALIQPLDTNAYSEQENIQSKSSFRCFQLEITGQQPLGDHVLRVSVQQKATYIP